MEWITPKTDWTKDDYYNYDDLNRVENNTLVVADMLNITISNAITNRDYSSLTFADTLNRIEANIQSLKTINITWTTMKTTWVGGSDDSFSYDDANRLEINLLNLYTILSKNIKARMYCGESISGQNICGGGFI